ncbi:reverse transcriptase [Senna tora]|uniref:Reverse transcriptase n=1 Tax=Senna tora TaxID=362788 RepID=A0A835CJM6_9FABA|nr:reverse transcriptase [Senna tora]
MLERGVLNYSIKINPRRILEQGESNTRISNPMQPPYDLFLFNEDLSFYLKMNILAWNVRGAGGADFRRVFRETYAIHQPDAVILTETRVSGERANGIINSLGFEHTYKVDAMGFAGGIWVLWNSNNISIRIVSSSFQEVHSIVKVGPLSFILTSLYASPNHEKRKKLWDSLAEFSTMHSHPWLIMGDFNDISNNSEKFGGRVDNSNCMRIFNNFLNISRLIDLGFVGPLFTWTNCQPNGRTIRTRIDRAHANKQWLDLFPETKVFHLPRFSSDHCPILLRTNPHINTGQKLFRLETFWLKHPNFKGTIYNIWNSSQSNLDDNLSDSDTLKISDPLLNWPPSEISTFPIHIKNELTSTFVHLNNNMPDQMAWKYSKDGTFTIKSAYNLISNENQNETANLNWLWKPPVHPRETFFLWKTYQNALPTAKKLHSFNCLQNPLCQLCSTEEETVIDILRDCYISRGVWDILKVPHTFFQTTIQPWLKHNATDSSTSYHNVPWNCLFTYTLRDSQLGSGGIIRDENENHVISFSHYPGSGNVIIAELYLLLSFPEWNIRHCYREANKCADALANFGRLSKLQLSINNAPPAYLINHLHHDQQSCHVPRAVSTSRPSSNVFATETI